MVRTSRWPKKEKKKGEVGLFVRLAPIVFLGLVAVGLFLFWRSRGLFKGKELTFSEQGKINFLLVDDEIYVFSFSLKKELNVVFLPGEIYAAVPGGYGAYRLNQVYNLGKIEKQEGALLLGAVSKFLGAPLDGYIYIPGLEAEIKSAGDLKKNFLGAGFPLELTRKLIGEKAKLETDISPVSLLRLWAGARTINLAQINFLDLAKSGLLEKMVLADGSQALTINPERLDTLSKDVFRDFNFEKENYRVEIINTTKTAGLAREAARILTNSGVSVINLGTGEREIGKCEIRAPKELVKTYTVARVQEIFDCAFLEKVEKDRADVSMSLGREYRKMLEGN